MLPILFIRTQVSTNKIQDIYLVTGNQIRRKSVISLNHLASKGCLYPCRVIIEKPVPGEKQAEYYVFDFTGRAFMVRIEEYCYDAKIETALYWVGEVDILKNPPHRGTWKSYAIKRSRILSAHFTPDEQSTLADLTRYILDPYPQWFTCFTTSNHIPHCRDRYL